MSKNNIPLTSKGKFEKISPIFLKEGLSVLTIIAKLQKKYGKADMDTLINELHDSVVGNYLGFKYCNVEKHGFDCKYSKNKDIFLESKVASFSSKEWNATFNDTTIEKANEFKKKNVWIALSVWEDTNNLLFICYGNNPNVGKYLEEKVILHKKNKTIRSTQTLSINKLIDEYNFQILAIGKSKEEIYEIIKSKHKSIKKLKLSNIQNLDDYNPKNIEKK